MDANSSVFSSVSPEAQATLTQVAEVQLERRTQQLIGENSLPASYLPTQQGQLYERIPTEFGSPTVPNVTAIVLNWSRFPNVIDIVSLLCSVEDVISEVIVWNNNPLPISPDSFPGSTRSKLRLINSNENIYFQHVLNQSLLIVSSKYGAEFISEGGDIYRHQDDDYLVRPEIIRALYKRITASVYPTSIHLLPPHEHLSSRSLSAWSEDGRFHTSFAWLGHGTMMHRSLALSFLSAVNELSFSEEEKKMADNYFTILRNDYPDSPEIWMDRGIELGGGVPFTAGNDGEQRNRDHIQKATGYLHIALYSGRSQDFVSSRTGRSNHSHTYAACVGTSSLLSTGIDMADEDFNHVIENPLDLLSNGTTNLESLSSEAKEHYISHSLAHAVDGDATTFFTSAKAARDNDYLMIDVLTPVGQGFALVEMALLVSVGTARTLGQCEFATSMDSVSWSISSHSLQLERISHTGELIECSMIVLRNHAAARYFRVQAKACNPQERWIVYDIWLRALG